jgi:transcriptional regulator with GAF, ATPase, and Fis domain
VLEHAAILSRNGRIRIDLPSGGMIRSAASRTDAAILLTDDERRDRDRANIQAALEACGGKVFGPGGAAELLHVRPTTLASRIKTLGIEVKRGRNVTAQ